MWRYLYISVAVWKYSVEIFNGTQCKTLRINVTLIYLLLLLAQSWQDYSGYILNNLKVVNAILAPVTIMMLIHKCMQHVLTLLY